MLAIPEGVENVRDLHTHYAAIRKRLKGITALPVVIPIMARMVDLPVKPEQPSIEALSEEAKALERDLCALEGRMIALKKALDPKTVGLERVLRIVATYYNVSRLTILGSCREREPVRARHIAMYLARSMTPHSYITIGTKFRRDHTSCIHGFYKVQKRIQDDPAFAAEIEQIKGMVLGNQDLREVQQ